MTVLLALDQGTTSSRAIVFDRGGSIVASAQQELRQSYPASDWVERDPLEIWQSQLRVTSAALAEAKLGAHEIAARWRAERRFEPRMGSGEVQALMDKWRRAVARGHGWEKDGDQ
jgi:glycerol kinase